MKVYKLVIIVSFFLGSGSLWAEKNSGEGPFLQKTAQNWLRVEIVEKTATGATARIVKAYKTQEALKVEDTITLSRRSKEAESATPKQKPDLFKRLRKGMTVYAFVNKLEEAEGYYPAAGTWSFAPPFGIPEADLKKYEIELPRPPKMPPPPKGRMMGKPPALPGSLAPSTQQKSSKPEAKNESP